MTDKELEQQERDAERYRWLCNNNFDRDRLQIHTFVQWYEPHSVTGEPQVWSGRLRGSALDGVIDKAMAEEAEAERVKKLSDKS